MGGELGENFPSIQGDFKTTAGGRLQLQSGNLMFEFFQYFLRQTDGMRLVISGGTVFDSNRHRLPPLLSVALDLLDPKLAGPVRRFLQCIPAR